MPQFAPSEEKVAKVTFPVKPAGLSCTAELYLVSDSVKVVTSGKIPFTSTGIDKSLQLPITMPSTTDEYRVLLDVLTDSTSIAAFEGVETVTIATPGIPIYCPDFAILDVEGIEFVSVGTETMQNWIAFGWCLNEKYGPVDIFGTIVYRGIADGVGLANCMAAKGLPFFSSKTKDQYDEAMYQCVADHPEYLDGWAKEIPPQEYMAYMEGDYYVGQVIEYETYTLTITGSGWNSFKEIAFYSGWRTYKYPRWQTIDWGARCEACSSALAPFSGLTATLAEPIVMSAMRGISMTAVGGSGLARYIDVGYSPRAEVYLWYEPTFAAPMPPPAYKGSGRLQVGEETQIGATGVFGAGYWYPGIYDGKVQVRWVAEPYSSGYMTFIIKNLARVTGTGHT